jgi:hypothetical protein
MLKTVAFIHGHKWTGMMIKRVYFGNWLRDYSQAVDVGTLKGIQSDTIRILVWVLSFLSFGYATAEFEVTAERLGVYRPEEHIDNPRDYADNQDARVFDQRLRPPVRPIELEVDPETGMKNYIANERGDWATSAAYVKYSFQRSIHYGRMYTNGSGSSKGNEADLCEALRCLGQGLHTLEDFGAHTNYTELALREMGFHNIFSHTGTATEMNVRGRRVFPLVTGTFGMVDFFHSVLGEATDHFTQSEVNEMDNALLSAQQSKLSSSSSPLNALTKVLSKVPGTGGLAQEAQRLEQLSNSQEYANNHTFKRGVDVFHNPDGSSRGSEELFGQDRAANPQFNNLPGQQWGAPPDPQWGSQQWNPHDQGGQQWNQGGQQWNPPHDQQFGAPQGQFNASQNQQFNPNPNPQFQAPPGQPGGPAGPGLPGMPNFNPQETVAKIYPILEFRDKVVRTISAAIEKIPGLEALVDKITETLTVFILSLLAPFVRPIINAVSKQLQSGSSTVIDASGKHQFEPWTDPNCTDPTHSLLSKDHFSNVLNAPAGQVASAILKYVAPRVLYAWQHIDVPVEQVMADVMHVFHHPAVRDNNIEVHRTMYDAVKHWVDTLLDRGHSLNEILSSASVRAGKNHKEDKTQQNKPSQQHQQSHGQSHGGHGSGHPSGFPQFPGSQYISNFMPGSGGGGHGQQSHGQAPWEQLSHLPIPGMSELNKLNKLSNFLPGGRTRELDLEDEIKNPQSSASGRDSEVSPGPISPFPPPAGYEQYSNQGGYGGYNPPTEGAHQSESYHHYQGSSGGAAGSYYTS